MSNRYLTINNPASFIASFMSDDSFFDSLFGDSFTIPTKISNSICSAAYPKSDIYTTEDGALHIECAVAGYSEDEIIAEYRDNYIEVSLMKENPKESRRYLQRGIKYNSKGSSTIKFYVDPTYYDANKIESSFKNGLLEITVPRNSKLAKDRILFGNPKRVGLIDNKADCDSEE